MKRDEANERNQEKKAIAADNWYLLHGFAAQPSAASRTVVTLAVEDAAASRRYDKTYNITKHYIPSLSSEKDDIIKFIIENCTYQISYNDDQ